MAINQAGEIYLPSAANSPDIRVSRVAARFAIEFYDNRAAPEAVRDDLRCTGRLPPKNALVAEQTERHHRHLTRVLGRRVLGRKHRREALGSCGRWVAGERIRLFGDWNGHCIDAVFYNVTLRIRRRLDANAIRVQVSRPIRQKIKWG